MSKLLLLTLNEQEEKVINKIIAAISDCVSLEAVQTIPCFGNVFSGTGNKAEPTQSNSRRGRSLPYPP